MMKAWKDLCTIGSCCNHDEEIKKTFLVAGKQKSISQVGNYANYIPFSDAIFVMSSHTFTLF
jgi:hypothetical protein